MKIFFPIAKVDVAKRQVWGRAAQEVGDQAKEIFDYDSSVPLFKEWSDSFAKATESLPEPSLGNIRAMHQKVAAGKVISIEYNDTDKAIDIGTEIVDDQEWEKVQKGVYTGFSIGGDYLKRWTDDTNPLLKRYTAKPKEISLVDNPCCPTARFSVVKADGSSEELSFQTYGLLKAAIEKQDMKIGELLFLAKEYLPENELDSLVKVDAPIADIQERLAKLVADAPAPIAAPVVATSEAATGETPAAGDAPAEQAPTTEKVLKHLRKGMYSVQTFAGILQSLAWLASDVEYEKEWEKDASTIPADLRTALQLLCEIFKKMSAEETDELIASLLPDGVQVNVIELAASNGDLNKAGKRHSKVDQDLIQAMHDNAMALGADCGEAEKVAIAKAASVPVLQLLAGDALSELGKAMQIATGTAPTEPIAKSEDIDVLAKAVVAIADERDTLSKRVKYLEAQPAPAKGVLRVVGKSDDVEGLHKNDEAIKPDPTNPKAVMAKVHAQGGTRITL